MWQGYRKQFKDEQIGCDGWAKEESIRFEKSGNWSLFYIVAISTNYKENLYANFVWPSLNNILCDVGAVKWSQNKQTSERHHTVFAAFLTFNLESTKKSSMFGTADRQWLPLRLFLSPKSK